MVHMTGMVAFVHAYYVLDLRHADGWIGYGGRIHGARFKALARARRAAGARVQATQVAARRRRASSRATTSASRRRGPLVYEGDQTALWQRVEG